MLVNFLHKAAKYRDLRPGFAEAFDFLQTANLRALPPGRLALDGDSLFVIIERAQGKGVPAARLEAHRKYIDIQFIVEGGDTIGVRPLADCFAVAEPYDPERDIEFYADAPADWVALPAGSFMILFPEDAHAPLAGQGEALKAIVKVAVGPKSAPEPPS